MTSSTLLHQPLRRWRRLRAKRHRRPRAPRPPCRRRSKMVGTKWRCKSHGHGSQNQHQDAAGTSHPAHKGAPAGIARLDMFPDSPRSTPRAVAKSCYGRSLELRASYTGRTSEHPSRRASERTSQRVSEHPSRRAAEQLPRHPSRDDQAARREEMGLPLATLPEVGERPHAPPPLGVQSPAEALAQAQALLDFPPEASRMDAWRAKILAPHRLRRARCAWGYFFAPPAARTVTRRWPQGRKTCHVCVVSASSTAHRAAR